MSLTLMAVHAHPDDESISTGGILALYAKEGIRTVLVTCTDGGCGDGPGGIKPDNPEFDRDAVVAERTEELAKSCAVLGIDHLETLGYRDSGMMGWPQNDEPGSFWTTPVSDGAARLAELIRQYQPDVVVTYDANGFYGHPDHIQAHRITMAAAEETAIPAKVYHTAVPRSAMAELGRRMRELDPEAAAAAETAAASGDGGGADAGSEPGEGPREEWGRPDHEITTFVDVGHVANQKFDSLMAHASQSDNIFFLRMGRETFTELMRTESFVRVVDRTGAQIPEDDLFAGLR